jgi:hypothetical protein
MTADIVPFGLPRPVAQELIHRLASEGQFTREPEFIRKQNEREFSMRQVLETIKLGSINQGPTLDECGDWRCRVKKRVAGRLVRIVLAIHSMNYLYLVSVH